MKQAEFFASRPSALNVVIFDNDSSTFAGSGRSYAAATITGSIASSASRIRIAVSRSIRRSSAWALETQTKYSFKDRTRGRLLRELLPGRKSGRSDDRARPIVRIHSPDPPEGPRSAGNKRRKRQYCPPQNRSRRVGHQDSAVAGGHNNTPQRSVHFPDLRRLAVN